MLGHILMIGSPGEANLLLRDLAIRFAGTVHINIDLSEDDDCDLAHPIAHDVTAHWCRNAALSTAA